MANLVELKAWIMQHIYNMNPEIFWFVLEHTVCQFQLGRGEMVDRILNMSSASLDE